MGSKDRTREMRAIILLSLASLALGAPRPQEYSGDTSALEIESLGGTIQEIFGKQSAGGYGATEESGDLNTQQEDQTIDVLVQVVKEGFPGDYVEPNDNLVEDKATVEVDTVFEHCHEYTESLGYECVPYYQCPATTAVSALRSLTRTSPQSLDTPATSARSGWRTKSTNWRTRETELASLERFSSPSLTNTPAVMELESAGKSPMLPS